MRQVFTSAGHSNQLNGDRGAKGLNNIWEGDLTIDLRDRIVKQAKLRGVDFIIDNNQNALSQTLTFLKTIVNNKTIALDIHWNAFNGLAKGCEVIIPLDASDFEKKLAQEILDCVVKNSTIISRGVKTEAQTARKKLGWMRTDCETVLLEVCFIDNVKDMESYNTNKDIIANKIAETLIKFAKI